MPDVHKYLTTVPFDIYELAIFHLVVRHRSFSRAAEAAGLTQSAITRQIQGMEAGLGLDLLERTTRTVKPTPAGDFLFHESARLLGDVDSIQRRLHEEFTLTRREVRIGVSRTVGLAYLPGFLHANHRRRPEIGTKVTSLSSREILEAIEASDLDLGVLTQPRRLPKSLRVTHRFKDAFTLIAPNDGSAIPASKAAWQRWAKSLAWIAVSPESTTGTALQAWMHRLGWKVDPAMVLDSFDLIINLVALGLGASFVPIRALALYGRKRGLRRIPLRPRFVRELVVVMRHQRKPPDHVLGFVENILF